jgi:predicted transposase YbfD/YdcC
VNINSVLGIPKTMLGIMDYFEAIPDPRIERKKLHKLYDIIFITITAAICGIENWEDVEEFGEIRYDWLKTVLELPNGIPSHDTFNRVFSLIDPKALEQCFRQWVQSVAQITKGQIISIDGKRLCNNGEGGNKSMIHMVSAWSNANNMVLAQYKVNDKSNEITAIPALLQMLHIEGCLITIDAMGCQKDIAEQIIEQGADYILAVKDNQKHLHDDIKDAFRDGKILQQDTMFNTGHGRIEKRICSIIEDTDWVCSCKDWKGLKTLIRIESERTQKATGETEKQIRYYITSKKANAKIFNDAVRDHWGIENKLHWVLDVAFGEDKSTKRAGNSAENFSFITKIALNLIKKHDDRRGVKKLSTNTKRKKASWDKDYLLTVLAGAIQF